MHLNTLNSRNRIASKYSFLNKKIGKAKKHIYLNLLINLKTSKRTGG